jgi:hypothetical protein
MKTRKPSGAGSLEDWISCCSKRPVFSAHGVGVGLGGDSVAVESGVALGAREACFAVDGGVDTTVIAADGEQADINIKRRAEE